MACVYGLEGDKEKCREWLLKANEYGTLMTFEYAKNDNDLKIVHDQTWFKNLNWAKEIDSEQ